MELLTLLIGTCQTGRMNNPDPREISQAIAELAAAGYAWKQDGDGQIREHLARHSPGNLTVGSKFSHAAWDRLDEIYQHACDRAVVALAEALRRSNPLRVEIILPGSDAGTEGVASNQVCDELSTLTRTRLVRDPGTVYEQIVDAVVLTSEQAFPSANQFIAPAGVLWDTKDLGLYTLFPGSASRPFPRDEQSLSDPIFHQANVDFWNTHTFLATPEQAIHALVQAIQAMEGCAEKRALVAFQQEELARVRDLVERHGLNQAGRDAHRATTGFKIDMGLRGR